MRLPKRGRRSNGGWVFRHPLVIRVTHWINAACLAILLMSGLQIFNAHPALYWGKVSTFDHPLLSMTATNDDPPRGLTTVVGHSFDTTGVLGLSTSAQGEPSESGFPYWGHAPGRSGPGDRAAVALPVRVDLRHQRVDIPALRPRDRAASVSADTRA